MPPRILLGIGGGIAAYKAADLCSKLAQSGHDVRVIMTASATHFIGPATLAALSGHPVVHEPFDARHPLGTHIQWARDVDLMLIAPATANLIGKFAHGIADDALTTTYLQNTAPVLIAPAMSDPMWRHPAVQRNLQTLRQDGVHLVGPESGWLSCRVRGEGRLSDPAEILRMAQGLLSSRPQRPEMPPSADDPPPQPLTSHR